MLLNIYAFLLKWHTIKEVEDKLNIAHRDLSSAGVCQAPKQDLQFSYWNASLSFQHDDMTAIVLSVSTTLVHTEYIFDAFAIISHAN